MQISYTSQDGRKLPHSMGYLAVLYAAYKVFTIDFYKVY